MLNSLYLTIKIYVTFYSLIVPSRMYQNINYNPLVYYRL